MRLKVPREALIARVKEVRDAEQTMHDERLAEFEHDTQTYADRLADFYESLAAAIREGELPKTDRWHHTLVGEPEEPTEPRRPDTSRHDRVIRQLEMAVDDLVTVNTTDYSEYL
jgi:hypothetical protein